jgi:uncharacterized protein (DUF2267 family)
MKFQQYAQDAHKFIKEVAVELGDPDNVEQAERVMAAVLHTFRDIITPEESLHLMAQFPMIIKAIYVNGWHLGLKNRIKSTDEFIECLMLQNPRTASADFGTDDKAINKTKAVISVLRRHIAVGEVKDIVSQLPTELAELWLTEKEEHERYSI